MNSAMVLGNRAIADYLFDLPEGQIAQTPPAARDGARLMILPRGGGPVEHRQVSELAERLPHCLLVINDSRVIPARVFARRPTGGRVELLLIEQVESGAWKAMLRSAKGPRAGERLRLEGKHDADGVEIQVISTPREGRCEIRLPLDVDLHQVGETPLPPYIRRPPTAQDRERYQTVYACHDGSIAAPTAGLHLTRTALERIEQSGSHIARLTLHVGPGTFVPVRSERIDDHLLESERYRISSDCAAAIEHAKRNGLPVIAVGTTSVRALEASGGRAGEGRAELFIRPGHAFAVVDGLLTNFHLPGSTLLMLVSALAGRDRVLAAYRQAVSAGYRFFSYGDAMLII
jgi:S-adenosylmethionine:tRNA ribosyltransferase-isomerase